MRRSFIFFGMVFLLLFSVAVSYCQVEYLWISAADMTPYSDTVEYEKLFAYTNAHSTASTDVYMVASVNLPDGATINGMYFFFEDNTTTGHIYMALFRVNVQAGISQEMFRADTIGDAPVAGMQVASDWTVSQGQKEVKNSTFDYVLHVYFGSDESAGNLRFHGVRIHYTPK